jgi:hypothetical protein
MRRNELARLLKILLEIELTESATVRSFGDAKSSKEDIVVSFSDGNEFQIIVFQSKFGKEDE